MVALYRSVGSFSQEASVLVTCLKILIPSTVCSNTLCNSDSWSVTTTFIARAGRSQASLKPFHLVSASGFAFVEVLTMIASENFENIIHSQQCFTWRYKLGIFFVLTLRTKLKEYTFVIVAGFCVPVLLRISQTRHRHSSRTHL